MTDIINPDIILVWVSAITAVGGLLAVIWRGAIKSMWIGFRNHIAGFFAMIEEFPGLLEDLRYVKKEVTYNGGSSSKDMLRLLSNSVHYLLAEASISTFVSDANGEIIDISDSAVETLRCQKNSILGSGWKSYVVPDRLPRVNTAWTSIVRDGRNALIDDVALRVDGELLVVNVEVVALKNSEGKFTGHMGYVTRAEGGRMRSKMANPVESCVTCNVDADELLACPDKFLDKKSKRAIP